MSLQILSRSLKLIISSNNASALIYSYSRVSAVCGCSYSPKLPKFYSMKTSSNIIVEVDPETGEKKKKKTTIIPKITLLSNEQIHVVTMEEAQKMAKRRDLKLVKIVDLDTKTQRPIYKLMTGLEYHQEDLKQREKRKQEKQKSFVKGEKVLILSQNISEHDLMTQVNKVLKWVQKSFEVRVIINGDSTNMTKAENVYSLLEQKVKSDARVLQKRQKGSDLKFQILPSKKEKDDSSNNSDGCTGDKCADNMNPL